MKKLLALAVIAASFTACNDAAKTTETSTDTAMVKTQDTVPVVTTTTTTTETDTLKKSDVKADTTKKK